MTAGQDGISKRRHFTSAVILWALRWYLAFPISDRDRAAMLSDRGVTVDHTTLFRWVQAYAAELEQRVRRHLRPCTGSWRVDETYIKAKGVWSYLYRAVDSLGQTIDFLLSAQRDTAVAKQLLRKSAGPATHREPAHDHGEPEPGLPACGGRHEAGELWRFSRLRQRKYPEQHRRAGSSLDQTPGPAGTSLRRLGNR